MAPCSMRSAQGMSAALPASVCRPFDDLPLPMLEDVLRRVFCASVDSMVARAQLGLVCKCASPG